jgi:hypothetical protein
MTKTKSQTIDLTQFEGHTPGPWRVFIDDSGRGETTGWPLSITADYVTNDNGDGRLIVRTGGFYPYAWDHATSIVEANANARLIAAAPDLLAAYKAALARAERAEAKYADTFQLYVDANEARIDAERQRDEAIAAFDARAEAMREACAKAVWPYVRGLDDVVRAIPIPAQEK